MAIAKYGGKACVFQALRKQKWRARLLIGQCLTVEPHGLEGGAHLGIEIVDQRLSAFVVLAFGGYRDTPRQRSLELARIKVPLGVADRF